MRRVSIFLVFALAASAAFGADNSLGTWKLNTDRSKTSSSQLPIKSLTTIREASDGGVKVTNTGERADGTPVNSTYTAKYDGTDSTVMGAPWDTISIKRVNDNTFTITVKQSSGKYNATGRTVISKDGKTMTTTTKGIDADGKPFTTTLVYEKQ